MVVFAHQDVFLPDGWIENVSRAIKQIEISGTVWGVAGIFGVTRDKPSVMRGYCYSTGLQRILGEPFAHPIAAHTLDEMVLIVRRSSGLRFDGKLPGFHLYGADICLQSTAAGLENFIVPAFCIHNSNGIVRLPSSFWQAYFYLRKKWQKHLPIRTCCTTITRLAWPVLRRIAAEWKERLRPLAHGKRLDHIAQFYDDLRASRPGIIKQSSSLSVPIKIGLLGATFGTPNLGVSVLATGAIGCMRSAFPYAQLFFLDYARDSSVRTITIAGSTTRVPLVNMRFSKKIWMPNNITTLLLAALVARVIPVSKVRSWITQKNRVLREISTTDLFGAVSGGDSFSDLYGWTRFLYVALPQILVVVLRKRLVLLPQTFGPFRHGWTRLVAKWIVLHAERAWSRDRNSLADLIGGTMHPINALYRFCFDLGFGIDSRAPKHTEVEGICLDNIRQQNLIGINVSGLLVQDGRSGRNQFNIRANYCELVCAVIGTLLASPGASALLIPHVYGSGINSESDALACEQIFAELRAKYPGRIGVLRGEYDPNEIRYLIGRCGFFVGSRMHACIAAVSQCIPAVSIAYSDKFLGVMRPVGVDALVADARVCSQEHILAIVQRGFDRRAEFAKELQTRMPGIRMAVSGLMRTVSVGVPADEHAPVTA
jgi:polysaccharide pyruvyl transferase WcaK-like protein